MAALLKKRALAEYSQVIQEQPKPLKKLRLAKKITPGSSAAAYVGLLEKSKTSNDALQILLRISDSQKFQEKDLPDTIKKLAEHFQREQESVVRAKVLSLLGDIGKESGADVQVIIEEVMQAMKNEESHKVISQGISSLLKLGKLLPDNVTTHHRLVSFVKQYLSDTSHSVKCKCLELMGELVSVSSDAGTIQPLLRLVGDYTHCEEARVRSAAFNTMLRLHERGLKLDPSVYSEVCLALKDDYEIVRQVALRIVWVLGQTYSENLVTLPDSDEEIRLVDDAFGKICHMINDLSMRVRTQAARLLGSMTSISPRFLQQTLDKKLMSNMRRKRSAHERAWESITSGEWSSGRNWADDAPRELVDAESVSLVNSGSCGAFVHGLEDEYQEVRNASVESLCSLAMNNPQFALMSLDFLVDMFNDEIEEVRLKAIDSLTKISRHIILREDQLETILGALKDFSIDVREGLHKMLASCRLSSKGCLQMCVEALLENLKKYPVDRKSTWCCLQKVGQQHPELTLILVPELLAIHPFFDMPEPDVEDPAYVSILILVLNAAQHCPTMLQLFEEHTLKHYCYLRDTMPHLVPALKVGGSSGVREVVADEEANATAVRFLEAMVSRLEAARRGPARVRAELLAAAQRDLARLAEVGGAAGDAARMSALHVNCQVMLARVLESRLWASPGALASQQGAAVRTNITQLLHDCLRLQYLFIGVSEDDLALVKQLKLKALALQLVYIVRCSNSSALALCDHFLEQVEDVHSVGTLLADGGTIMAWSRPSWEEMKTRFVSQSIGSRKSEPSCRHAWDARLTAACRYLGERGIAPEAFTASLVKEMSQLEETKPGPVARCLLPLLQNAPPVPQLRPTTSVQMTTATLACEPGGDADAPLKFTAGLVLGVPLEAELRYLQSPELLRIKVRYPDQQTHLLVPPRGDLRPGTTAGTSRLLTRALVSHQVWSEACALHIGLALDLAAVEGGTAAATAARRARAPADADPCLLDLCKPVKVYVSPKPVKRGI